MVLSPSMMPRMLLHELAAYKWVILRDVSEPRNSATCALVLPLSPSPLRSARLPLAHNSRCWSTTTSTTSSPL